MASTTPTPAPDTSPTAPTHQDVQRLRGGAVGLFGVLFMAVATAAPITAMVGNVPIAIGFGNGAYAPAGYAVATIVLTLFAFGYSSMAKHITATGAFYGFISHGLGRIIGMGAGALTTLAYVVFEASLVGIFSFFAHSFFANHLGMDVPWIVFALLMLAVNGALTYFDVDLTAKVLGVLLLAEVGMLLAVAATPVLCRILGRNAGFVLAAAYVAAAATLLPAAGAVLASLAIPVLPLGLGAVSSLLVLIPAALYLSARQGREGQRGAGTEGRAGTEGERRRGLGDAS